MKAMTQFKLVTLLGLLSLMNTSLSAGEPDVCLTREKDYNTSSFQTTDFLTVDQGIVVDEDIELDNAKLDLENLVLGLEQPFYVDYLSEGAGASHLFGFFFFDIDTDKDGFPDFFEVSPTDDLDGDGLLNRDDTDDDGDGIPDVSDTRPTGVTTSMPASAFRNGTLAETSSVAGNDYWQFVPNSVLTDGSYAGYFEHPGAYLYVDNNGNNVPDALEYEIGRNKVPPYVTDKGYTTEFYTRASMKGLQGNDWPFSGTPGTTTADKYHWTGSTIFYIADDDGGTGQDGSYTTYLPYRNGSNPLYSDTQNNTDAAVDYLIYGSSSASSTRIPSVLVDTAANGTKTFVKDKRGQEMYKYRWYQSNISGSRELVFYLVVFYGSGGANVQTYYSKSAFNKDLPPASPGRNAATTGDQFGRDSALLTGTNASNWFPQRSNADHNELANRVWGFNWIDIASAPVDGTSPVLNSGAALKNPAATQEWVDKWENYRSDRRILQYRALADWFNQTAVDANTIINGRYGIDMSAEGDSSIIRSIDGKMVHLMVGAPTATKDAWLLGWEDLFNGGDRDYEDVVFYVKRQAGGELVSLNVADDIAKDLNGDAEYSLSQVSFTFEDNFTDDQWGVEGTYIAYFYRLAQNDEWTPLLGGEAPDNLHYNRTVDKFQPAYGGSTVINGSTVTRTVTIVVEDKKTELFWKVQMASESLDNAFQPKVTGAKIGYQSLVHDFYYNGAVIPNSNISYIGSHETPYYNWNEKRNRGHLYALQTFIHGSPLTLTKVADSDSPENNPGVQPVANFTKPEGGTINLFKWDAGVSMLEDLNASVERTLYSYVPDNNSTLSTGLSSKRVVLDRKAEELDQELIDAFEFSNDKTSANVWVDNYQHPSAEERDPNAAALWLINWLHGIEDPVVSNDGLVSAPVIREWIMGGINRASPLVIRAPGRPSWLDRSSDISILDKRSYLAFTKEQNELPTRILIGTESGIIHCIDAGEWVGEKEKDAEENEYDWAEGHYKDENFGTGREVWGMLPGHFLPDVKYNYTNASDVVAKIDSTAVAAVIKAGSDWRRIAIFSQGYRGGSQTVNGVTRTGNVIFALDLTDVDNPLPLWQRSDSNTQDIVNPITLGWMKFSDSDKRWVVCYPSGGSPIAGQTPGFHLVDAYTGEDLRNVSVGSANSAGVETMLGTPALVDSDGDGYIDRVIGATSEGWIFAYNNISGTMSRVEVPSSRFFVTPNIDADSNGDLKVVAVTGDNPLIYDDLPKPFTNKIYYYKYFLENDSWDLQGAISLPVNQKAFSRPKLIGDQLVVGTTSGDTFNFCDADLNNPGSLRLYALDMIGTADELTDSIDSFGPVLAPVIVSDGRIMVNTSTSDSSNANAAGSVFNNTQSPSYSENLTFALGDVFGVSGWQNDLLFALKNGNSSAD